MRWPSGRNSKMNVARAEGLKEKMLGKEFGEVDRNISQVLINHGKVRVLDFSPNPTDGK